MNNSQTFNLIAIPWIPVIRASGRRDRIRPAGLTDEIDTDPILERARFSTRGFPLRELLNS